MDAPVPPVAVIVAQAARRTYTQDFADGCALRCEHYSDQPMFLVSLPGAGGSLGITTKALPLTLLTEPYRSRLQAFAAHVSAAEAQARTEDARTK